MALDFSQQLDGLFNLGGEIPTLMSGIEERFVAWGFLSLPAPLTSSPTGSSRSTTRTANSRSSRRASRPWKSASPRTASAPLPRRPRRRPTLPRTWPLQQPAPSTPPVPARPPGPTFLPRLLRRRPAALPPSPPPTALLCALPRAAPPLAPPATSPACPPTSPRAPRCVTVASTASPIESRRVPRPFASTSHCLGEWSLWRDFPRYPATEAMTGFESASHSASPSSPGLRSSVANAMPAVCCGRWAPLCEQSKRWP